jgi:hypothetical protein
MTGRTAGEKPTIDERLDRIESSLSSLDRIESLLASLVEQKTVKEWYSVDEVASRMGKAAYTVREWCRHDRILAQKRSYKRGKSAEWMISHEELLRVQNQGLLPDRRRVS